MFEARIKDETKFPATLQMLFYDLFHEDRAVSSEQLVRSFGWTKKDVQIQQDAQEFSCKFFEVLEDKLREACPESKHMSINELFEGELTHYIQCVEVCTSLIMSDFRTENSERFFDLQLGLSSDLATSLDEYVSEQLLSGDNMYRTEEHGLQKAVKGVRLSRLPPVLMIQLKRFQFNPYTESNEKLLSEFRYPEKINFGKWMMSEK